VTPTDLARRWKPYRAAVERADNATTALQQARERLEQLRSVIAEHKSSWHRETLTEISKAGRRYEAALTELEDARANLSATVGLNEWVASGGAAAGEPANDRLSGDSGGLGFTQVLTALKADLEHLTYFDSLDRERPVRPALELVRRAGSWGA
jgi:type II secretory pathway pseudopilin PulG